MWSNFRERFLKGEITRFGYLQFSLYINGKARRYRAHQLVALLFLPNPLGLPMVNHIDGNKLNNYYKNLEWCTAYDNNLHARKTGLNDISRSDSLRWKDQAFRKRTSEAFSKRIRERGALCGMKNPRFKYLAKHENQIIDRHELSAIIKKSLSYSDALIRRAADGETIDIFINKGITVTDTKESPSTIESVSE